MKSGQGYFVVYLLLEKVMVVVGGVLIILVIPECFPYYETCALFNDSIKQTWSTISNCKVEDIIIIKMRSRSCQPYQM